MALLGLAALAGGPAAAAGHRSPADPPIGAARQALESRVARVRDALSDVAATDGVAADAADAVMQKWLNWPNWANWNNWANWLNHK